MVARGLAAVVIGGFRLGPIPALSGVPQEVLFDNARALVAHHDAAPHEVHFTGLHAAPGAHQRLARISQTGRCIGAPDL
jgi:hypothetical protein